MRGGRVAVSIKFNFSWIDDRPDRFNSWDGSMPGQLRGEQVEATVKGIELTENFLAELDAQVDSWVDHPPNLILLDHDFSKVPKAKRPFGMHGSALAHLLRLKLPSTPIVCLSGQAIESDDFNAEDISEYTYLVPLTEVNTEANLEVIFAIAQDFGLLCFPDKEPIRGLLIDALGAPQADRDALLNILPEEFEGTFVHSTSAHRVARWVLNVLMKRPGFLCDSLEAATLLGLTETAFLVRVKDRFNDALYVGPFATESRPLWWASSLTDVLYRILPDHVSLMPQSAGRKLEGVAEHDFSVCAVSGLQGPSPDVIAYVDASKSRRVQVHHRHTVPFSSEEGALLGFSSRLRLGKGGGN